MPPFSCPSSEIWQEVWHFCHGPESLICVCSSHHECRGWHDHSLQLSRSLLWRLSNIWLYSVFCEWFNNHIQKWKLEGILSHLFPISKACLRALSRAQHYSAGQSLMLMTPSYFHSSHLSLQLPPFASAAPLCSTSSITSTSKWLQIHVL